MAESFAPRPRMHPFLRHGLEFGPVIVFFATMLASDIFIATAVLMALQTLAAVVAYAIERRVSGLILFGLVTVLAFGTLTLVLRDEEFIKIRPSIYFTALAVVLLIGLAAGRLFVKNLFEYAFKIDEIGWRKLTLRLALFFLLLAIANHLIWTNLPDSVSWYGYNGTQLWAAYKVFVVPVLMVLFMMAQTPLLMRHELPKDQAAKPGD